MYQGIIKNISLNLDINAEKRVEGNIDVKLYSKDIGTGVFEFSFIDEKNSKIELDETYSAKVMIKLNQSENIYVTDMEIDGDIARFVFPHGFITKDGTVTLYVYLTKNNKTSDVASISFKVFKSEIDDVATDIVTIYDKNYESILNDFEEYINLSKEEWKVLIEKTENFVEEIENITLDQFIEMKMDEKYNNIEQNYITRLLKTEQDVFSLNEQLADAVDVLETKADKINTMTTAEFDSWVATLLDGGPSIFMDSLAQLQSAYPNGSAGVALVRETDPAKIYVWNGSVWADFGEYQGIELKDGVVTLTKINIDGYLPLGLTFTRQTSNRIRSQNIFVEQGMLIKSTDGVNITVYSQGESGDWFNSYPSWREEILIHTDETIYIQARFESNDDISNANLADFGKYVYVVTQQTSVIKSDLDNLLPYNVSFTKGHILPDGSITSGGTSISTPRPIALKKGDIISLKEKDLTRYALHDTISNNYINGGWMTSDYEIEVDGNYLIMQAYKNAAEIPIKNYRFFEKNIEIESPDNLVRVYDLERFTGKIETDNLNNTGILQVEKSISGDITQSIRDTYVYPLQPVWGYEYMYSWYEKLRTAQFVKMVWAGDSTTANTDVEMEFRRHSLGKKILTLGGYDVNLISSINSGQGSQHTGNWLGGDKDEDKRTPNGFLYEDMQENPDLYIFSYGFNDGSNAHFASLSWQERIDRFEENLNEGLERIRGSQYSKSPDDMAIILTTPISGYSDPRGNYPQVWNDRIRPIIQKACRDYKCAFVDITARQYDHGFSGSWSTFNDFTHPNETANVDYMSMFDGLIMPRLLHE